MTKFLSDYSKKSFEENVNRESANDKIKDLLTNYSDFYEEMSHFQKLNALGIPVNLTYFEWLKNISLLCVVAANITLLASNTSTDNRFGSSLSDRFIEVLGFIIMIIYLVIGGLWLLFNSHIDIMRTHRKMLPMFQKIQKIDSPIKRSLNMFGYFRDFFFSLLVNTYVLDLSMNITFAMLGVYYSKVFFSFMLLDIISRSDLLKNVIRSVTLNIG
jgi:inositol 1,4,5-triphosphate receptor type 3